MLYPSYKYGIQKYTYYTKKVKEFISFYSDSAGGKFTGDTMRDFITAVFKDRERMNVPEFIKTFTNAFKNPPFDINKHTLPFLFDTFNLNLQKVGAAIVNKDIVDLDSVSNELLELFKKHNTLSVLFREIIGTTHETSYVDISESETDFSQIVIPFSQIFKIYKSIDVYSGKEKIPFTERDPENRMILRQDFASYIKAKHYQEK